MTLGSDRDLEATAAGFHALSDPTRLRIIRLLSRGERCVNELTAALGISQSLLSFHLRVLRLAGVLSDRRDGRWMYYSINDLALTELSRSAAALQTLPEAWMQGDGGGD